MPSPVSSTRPSVPALVHSLLHFVNNLLFEPKYFFLTALIAFTGDALLTQLIIRFVSFTEIDWKTYMEQVSLYIKGERNYERIEGPTGPLVYPAGHVHIHELLYNITNSGQNLKFAQQIYGGLYLGTLVLTSAVYQRAGGVPNWIIFLLPLSKPLTQGAVLAYGVNMDNLGTLLFSSALSVKMSAVLVFPGILVVLFRRHGVFGTLRHLTILLLMQVIFAQQFLREDAGAYLTRAFDLSRVFLYKWTVNWRFLPEQTFLHKDVAYALLAFHAVTLMLFGAMKWCAADGGVIAILRRGIRRPGRSPALMPVTPDYVTTVLYTSNLIGIIFARSLHYQFYSWYAQQLPFLAWRTRYPIPVKILLLFAIEYAWNVFPSTSFSSSVLLVAHGFLLGGIWFGYSGGKPHRLHSIVRNVKFD